MKPEANKNSLSQLLFLQTMSLQAATKEATKESFAGYICLRSYLRLFSGNSIWDIQFIYPKMSESRHSWYSKWVSYTMQRYLASSAMCTKTSLFMKEDSAQHKTSK